jgi:O-antigen/teichoic acid export membrane protein
MILRSNAFVFLSGRILALVILMAFQILVVRMLPAKEYGGYALVIALATLMQTVVSFGIPRLIPKYASQAGWSLSHATVRRLLLALIAFRLGASLLVMGAALAAIVATGLIAMPAPALLTAGAGYILVSLVQVDADAMAQSLGLQAISRSALVWEAAIRLGLVGALAASAGAHDAAAVLAVSLLTTAGSGLLLLRTVFAALAAPDPAVAPRALDRREFQAVALAGYASAMAWFASSPAVVRLIASRLLPVTAFAGYSFAQGLVLSFQRYTPGMLAFPFIEPAVMQHHARTGDGTRLEAGLSIITKIDMVTIGAAVTGTIIAGRPLVEMMTGGRYGTFADALPWLLVYIATSSIYRAFEIVAVALGASRVLSRTLPISLAWLLALFALAPHFGMTALLAVPVADSLSRLGVLALALARYGVGRVVDGRVALGIVVSIAAWCTLGTTIVRAISAGPALTIVIGTVAVLGYAAGIALIRPLRKAEVAIVLKERDDRIARAIRAYARI